MKYKLKYYLVFIVIQQLSSNYLFSQTNTDTLILGKWVYGNVTRIGATKPIPEFQMRLNVGKNGSYHFLKNNRFRTCGGNCVNGDWKIEKNNKYIFLKTDEGKIFRFEITKLTNDTLSLNIRNKSIHTLINIPNAEDFEDKRDNEAPNTVRAKREQLIKRWKLSGIKNEKQKSSTNQSVADTYSNTTYEFLANGNLISKVLKEQTGNWKLGNDNTEIYMMFDNDGSVWEIISVTKNELIIKRPNSDNHYIFNTF